MRLFLQALYLAAAFEFIVRHPVTVTLATRKWRRRTPLPRLTNNRFTAQLNLPALSRAHPMSYEWSFAEGRRGTTLP